MSEMKQNLPPTLRSTMDEFYTAPPPNPAFAEGLEAQLRQRQIELMARQLDLASQNDRMATAPAIVSPKQKPGSQLPLNRSSFMHMLRTRPILAVIAAILALLLLTGIAYAVGRLSGFIPGIGFVNNVQSVLETPIVVTREMLITSTSLPSGKDNTPQVIPTLTAEPAKVEEPSLGQTSLPVQEKKGITITVEQVVAEADRLVIAYKIAGLPPDLFGPERVPTLQAFSEAHPDEPMPIQVYLPDGRLLDHANGGNCEGGGDLATSWLSCQSIYAPLPDGVNQFTFQIHRLQNALPDELPEDWVFPIVLTSISTSQATNGVEEPNLSSPPVNGITLRLLKVDRSSAQTAFQMGLEWEGQNRMLRNIDPITLMDDQGGSYPLTSGQEGDQWLPDHPNMLTFSSMVTNLADNRRPLTFRLNWVVMTATDQATLHFDPGKNAKIGQEWPMNQTIHAVGYDLHFTQVRLITDQDGSLALEFDIQAPKDIEAIVLDGANAHPYGGGYDEERGVWINRLALPGMVNQPLDLVISQIHYRVNGPWEITWQP